MSHPCEGPGEAVIPLGGAVCFQQQAGRPSPGGYLPHHHIPTQTTTLGQNKV